MGKNRHQNGNVKNNGYNRSCGRHREREKPSLDFSLKRQSRDYGLSILRLYFSEYLTVGCDYICMVFGFYG